MTRQQLEDLLSEHADRLASQPGPAGRNDPPRPTEPGGVEQAGLNPGEQRSLSGLAALARRVQSALVEVEPRPAFVADLKARLVAQRRAESKAPAGSGSGMLWVAGVAGALSVAGLGFLTFRAARAGAGWISAAVASRNARPALPKA
jgi:hypothetical protein